MSGFSLARINAALSGVHCQVAKLWEGVCNVGKIGKGVERGRSDNVVPI